MVEHAGHPLSDRTRPPSGDQVEVVPEGSVGRVSEGPEGVKSKDSGSTRVPDPGTSKPWRLTWARTV